jgi:hypothetical protein
MHAIRASRPMRKLLCEIAVPVDVGLVAEGRDPVDIGVCWCRIPQRARVGEPDNLQVALTWNFSHCGISPGIKWSLLVMTLCSWR